MSQVYHSTQAIVQLPLFTLTKVCHHCTPPKEKPIEEFAKERRSKDGHRYICKECDCKRHKDRYRDDAAFRDQVARKNREYHIAHRDQKLAYNRAYYAEHREQLRQHNRDYHASHKERIRQQRREYLAAHHEQNRLRCREYYRKNRERLLPLQRERNRVYAAVARKKLQPYYRMYRETHREQIRQSSREWRQMHKLIKKEQTRRYHARKKAVSISKVDYQRILERDNAICYICNKPIDLQAIPKSPASLTFDHRVPITPRPSEPQGTHTEENIFVAHYVCNVRKHNVPFELLTEWDRRGPHLRHFTHPHKT